MPFIPPRPPRPIPEKELKLALACTEEPIVTWLLLAGWMGLRAMEISGITRDAVVEVDADLVISGMGKGQRPFTLPVPDRLAPYLRAHLTRNGPLWRDGAGDPITAHAVSKITNRFPRRIGVNHTLHSLRHRFGAQLR